MKVVLGVVTVTPYFILIRELRLWKVDKLKNKNEKVRKEWI